jgi:hypothetical protein
MNLNLEMKTEEIRNSFMSHSYNITNKYFPKVEKFKYMEMAVMNKSYIFYEIMSRIISGNVYYYFFHTFYNLTCFRKT